MNRILSTALIASFCILGSAAHAQDKLKSLPSGQQKMTPDTPMGKTANEMSQPNKNDLKMNDGKMSDGKTIDANGDGMISKAEFMKHQESTWASMKKDSKGMVSAVDYTMPTMK